MPASDQIADAGPDWPALVAALVDWYRANHRELPWRPPPGQTGDPYRVLVAEAMLQQTQVATVVDYFNRFLAEFPTIQALASASEEQVLSAWQGLGYYRRARHLHRAAQRVLADHAGRVPDAPASIRRLPGVGDYTAGAIASIAFGRPEPIVDGNVARVLARVLAIESSIDEPPARKRLWAAARRAVEAADQPGDLNQALMELGATVCSPRGPRCPTCPARPWCAAGRAGDAERLPKRSPRRPARPVDHVVLAIERRGRWLVEQRGPGGLWAGLWQLVTREEPACDDHVAFVAERYGLRIADPVELAGFVHLTTHKRITFRLLGATVEGGRLRPNVAAWRTPAGMASLPMSNAQRRAVELLRDRR